MIPPNRLSGTDCVLCQESKLAVGELSSYGAKIIYQIGNRQNGWFATLSPKTGSDPEQDFSIQLIPFQHLKYFSELNSDPLLAANYGTAFAKICAAVATILKEEGCIEKMPLGTYGKCKHPDEHVHVKIFPWRGNIGQPYTVDSTYEKKTVYTDPETGEPFIKMIPVQKTNLAPERFKYLAERLMMLLN